MSEVLLGVITEEERDQIQSIYNRKVALTEIAFSLSSRGLSDNSELYERLVMDTGNTAQRMQTWWERTAQKYGWSYTAQDAWSVNFATRTVMLNAGK